MPPGGGLLQLVVYLGAQDPHLSANPSSQRSPFFRRTTTENDHVEYRHEEQKFIEVHVKSGECIICLEDFEDAYERDKKTDEALGIVTACCGIIIHKSCADQVVERQGSDKCPHCRQKMKK